MTRQFLRALICFSLVLNVYGQCLGDVNRVPCVVADVASFSTLRVHVQCSNVPEGFRYFAVPIDALGAATRLADAGTAAMQNPSWRFEIDYCPTDLSGANIGCLTTDCRLVKTFRLILIKP